MRRSALVTGGAGFIGSHLVDALVERDWQVTVLDDLSTGLASNVNEKARLIEGTILSRGDVAEAIAGADTVFHLAASVSVPYSVEKPEESLSVNAHGTFTVLEAARSQGVERSIYSGSSAAYGERPESPKCEDLAPMPLSPYAVGKLAGEHLTTAYAHSYGMNTVALRYFNVFGPRQRPDSPYAAVIPIFLARLMREEPLTVYGDGEQTRDFTHVSNIVNANLLAAESSDLRGQVVNVACGEEISVNRLIQELAKLTGKTPEVVHAPPRAGEVRYSVADCGLAEKLLGYRPLVSWEEGLRLTVEAVFASSP